MTPSSGNSGWSSGLFLEHAEYIKHHFDGAMNISRKTIYLSKNNKLIKICAERPGKDKEYVTLTDKNNIELIDFHYTAVPEAMFAFIQEYLNK